VYLLAALIPVAVLGQAAEDYDKRAREIVSKMTLDEKLTELHGLRDATHYRYVPGIARLGIPELRITNGPAGAGPDGAGPQPKATALPAPIALAATWDPRLARIYGKVVGGESRLLGNGLVEAPTINIARLPQNGRTFEGFGEDPYLSGQMSVQEVIGIQSEHVIADVKHYAANNQETDRRTVNEEVDERALREIYLPAFEVSIKEGHSASVMCAYPKVNGIYCCRAVNERHSQDRVGIRRLYHIGLPRGAQLCRKRAGRARPGNADGRLFLRSTEKRHRVRQGAGLGHR